VLQPECISARENGLSRCRLTLRSTNFRRLHGDAASTGPEFREGGDLMPPTGNGKRPASPRSASALSPLLTPRQSSMNVKSLG
jgi:hypothetical protein